jgi:hypothetical protein
MFSGRRRRRRRRVHRKNLGARACQVTQGMVPHCGLSAGSVASTLSAGSIGDTVSAADGLAAFEVGSLG